MKFSEFQYTRPDLSAVRARCEEICVETDLTIAYVRHSIDTRDEFYDQENEFSDEAGPQLEEMFQKINLALLGSKFRPELEEHFGKLLFTNMEISVRTFKPEILELMQEENRLASQYQKLYASGMVEFRGETMPLTKLGPYLQSPDRETRREAWTVRGSFFDANRAELDELYGKLIKCRNAQARCLGHENFIQLGYDRLGRNCYGQKELAAFRDQIANDLVPVIAEVKEAQRKRIGVDRLHIYDDKFRFPDGNPTPEGTAEEILAAGRSTTTSCSTCSPARARPPAATVRCLKNTRLRLSSRTLTAQPETSMC